MTKTDLWMGTDPLPERGKEMTKKQQYHARKMKEGNLCVAASKTKFERSVPVQSSQCGSAASVNSARSTESGAANRTNPKRRCKLFRTSSIFPHC